MTAPLFFDIETGPLSLDAIKQVTRPFKSKLKHPGEFDPASVKYGVTKDEAKRAAKLQECREKHEAAIAEYESKASKEESEYWQEIVDRAALSALTGQVLAIGYGNETNCTVDHILSEKRNGDEAAILTTFWSKFVERQKSRQKMIGFNIKTFDVPFLAQRSFILGVDVPEGYMEGDWPSKTFVDINTRWMAGSRGFNGTLDEIARACGVGQKPDGVSGALFYELYGNPETRSQALDYAINDVVLTRAIAMRIGI